MDTCAQCGHRLTAGRYCTNCGHPVAADVGAATRTVVLPAVTAPAPAPSPVSAAAAGPAPEPAPRHRRPGPAGSPDGLPWLVGFATLLLFAVLGTVLLFSGGDDSPGLLTSAPATEAASAAPSPAPTPEPTPDTTTSAPVEEPEDAATELAGGTSVEAPAPAPASRDTGGQPVTYDAANLLDGVPTTCWRMPGDGTGQSLTFTFPAPVELTRVGLVNGYAKVVTDGQGLLDWYRGNRRVRRVEWTFDDGTQVVQDLGETTDVQTTDIDPRTTQSVTLRLLAVSPPGPGRASRDYTAISDVHLLGTPATG